MAIREIPKLRATQLGQAQYDASSVSQKFSHTDSTPLSGIETNESYDYTLTVNGDTTALMKVKIVGETSTDYQTTVDSTIFKLSTHSSPYLNNPPLTFYKGSTYRFIQSNANNASHPVAFTESDGTTEYTSGVSNNGGTAGTDLITTITVPQDAPDEGLKYKSSGGEGFGNDITIADPINRTKYAEVEVFHDEVESKILTDIDLGELTLTPTRSYDSGTGTTDFTLTIDNDFQDAFFFSIYTEGYTYDKSVSGFTSATDVASRLFGDRGVFGGGYDGTSDLNTIEYISITTPSDATDFGGDLTETRYGLVATSDGSRGVFGGGYSLTESPVFRNTIDYITISIKDVNATDFGDLTQGRYYLSATSDGSRGVFGGGNAPVLGATNTIDYILISTPGDALDFGILTTIRSTLTATSDGSRGVFGGGYEPPSVVSTINYITISTPSNATDFGELTQSRSNLGATSDGSRGVFGGGDDGSGISTTIDYITISTPSDATVFGNLTQGRRQISVTSDGSTGVFGGGRTPSYVNTIDYITISTPGNALVFGGILSGIRGALAATSGD